MKRTLLLPILLLFLISGLTAQDPSVKDLKNEAARTITKYPKDTATRTWKLGGLSI